ncbi:hypothetical protein NDS46_04070 [Paenibacillus thiaminolyticus]|uniref:hypothetical protein n=1 Tax=Paenibacillus thiaminolyticus TaxID=49283 RepID=UPI00232C9BFE|nr:hypothetical protein [Paenibacillus thiaminolyticus]WCF09091.1 hypothetical protein NDS46_04070 [Paenibacillus thiaminolyticus]
MSPHLDELLRIYIILVHFAPSRGESGKIPAVLQDSIFGEVVPIELMQFCRICRGHAALQRSEHDHH